MKTYTEEEGTIVSPYKVHIPPVDLFSYILSSGNPTSRKSPQYFDATSPTVNLSIDEAALIAKRFGKGLQKDGLKKQDKVLLCSSNHLLYPVVVWGVTAAGGVFTGCSPTASAYELEYNLRDSEASYLLASPESIAVAVQAARRVGLPLANVYLFGSREKQESTQDQIRPWSSLWATEKEAQPWTWEHFDSLEIASSTTAVINYSSGSTGLPKGVELTHYNLIANAEQVIWKRRLMGESPEGRARHERLTSSGDRWLAAVPMYHAFGQSYFCVTAPRVQAKVYIMSKFHLETYLKLVDVYRITFINVVPAMLAMFCRLDHPKRFNLDSVEMVVSGAAPLDPATASQFKRLFLRPSTRVKQGWGMTETTCNVTGFAPDDDDDGRSIGWLNANCKAKIVPVPDREFESGSGRAAGELWVTGPHIMKGYWKREAETTETIVMSNGDRWLKTGDVATVDERGCFYIVDRLKELIKVNGLQVSPVEVEQCLMDYAGVEDAAVVGAKWNGKEFPQAFVVRKTNSVTEQALHALVREKLARHKWLTGGIFFVDSIPRNPSGKIVRRQLPTRSLKPIEAKL